MAKHKVLSLSEPSFSQVERCPWECLTYPHLCVFVHGLVCVCASSAEPVRCWQGCHIKPMALNSLCQLLQAAIDAPIT